MTPEDVLNQVALLSRKIADRRPAIVEHVAYYKGREGRMRFASDEFREYFAKRFAGFSDNWCMPVAQAPVERIHQLGIRLDGETTSDKTLALAWESNDADRGLSEALMMMTVAKRSFALVSPIPGQSPRITFENPDSAAVIYDGTTRQRKAGLTIWQDDTTEYAEFLTPASTISVKRDKVALNNGDHYVPPDYDGWVFDESRGAVENYNPLGAVPLVEFRNASLLDDDPISDISGVMAMQDSINLTWAYLLNNLDYASLPQRILTGATVPKEAILDQNGQKVGERPVELDALIRERILFVPGTDVKVDEWGAATLTGFSDVIEQAIAHIAAQTRIPGYYFFTKSNVPATGYELAEAGLVSKASERIGYATPVVREIYRLAALASGDSDLAKRAATGKVLWSKPQYRSEAQLMDGLLKMRQTGFPFQWIAEEYGLSPSEVDRVMQMVKDEQADPYLTQLNAKVAAAGGDPEPAVSGKGLSADATS